MRTFVLVMLGMLYVVGLRRLRKNFHNAIIRVNCNTRSYLYLACRNQQSYFDVLLQNKESTADLVSVAENLLKVLYSCFISLSRIDIHN